ncbi:hypothetical protein H257_13455 [Aphanomyces astaci]|uniref:DDE Tnp4 domain-containing protein n=1 Tax=Aphanomyces astaci TaxID=112090 RepID=W4FXD6_APHAT|nr:hypothetical protein H257_13455 [Aphanomyces astaci]ETV71328.1 hypothetical protein H257_13455 [Aphanomyces astaci]|eukprot:XP_009839268.1 hypothetical protein H257_13455 [Aphanomyces astaci]
MTGDSVKRVSPRSTCRPWWITKMKFMSYSIRSGSQNDKVLFRESRFGKTCHTQVPPGACFLVDGGYKLYGHLLTPYPLRFGIEGDEAHYTLRHSRTRMAVERAFRLWKNTLRIFQVNILRGSPEEMVILIKATLVLHNLFIDEQSLEAGVPDVDDYEDWMHIGGDAVH